jgi:hypothetical protein
MTYRHFIPDYIVVASRYLSGSRGVYRYRVAAKGKAKKLRVFDFDETLAVSRGFVSVVKASGEKISMDSATFAYFRPEDGDELDFSAFNDVINPRKIKKNWEVFQEAINDPDMDVLILTARPKGSASAVKKYLKSEGVEGIDVVALASSDPYDKARHIDKLIEDHGYTDVAFFDDSSRNAGAVREHGEKHKKKGVRFDSVNTPRPVEKDYAGAASKESFASDNPTTSKVQIKKPSAPGEDRSKRKPSDWWHDQTPEFQKDYCREHEKSNYCHTASESKMAAKDHNKVTKSQIKDRASKSKNKKIKDYVKEFTTKLDQAGPTAGIWMEKLEKDFDKLMKEPKGLLRSFTDKDFDELFRVLFGIDREEN